MPIEEQKKNRLIGAGVTLAVHALLVVVLVLCTLRRPALEEEQGVLLMVGLVDEAGGDAPAGGDPVASPAEPLPTASDVPPAPPAAPSQPEPPTPEPPLIAQNDEPAPAVPTQEDLERQKREAEARARAEAEARQRAEEERRRREEEERKRREAEAIDNLLTGAFGSGSAGDSHGSGEGKGAQGSPDGNAAQGATTGSAGWGTVDLGGRGLSGTLPRPTFNVNASGTVVVDITVNAAGQVTQATIGKGTTTSDQSLRRAAREAAQRARFAPKEGASDQTGTITYRFDSNN